MNFLACDLGGTKVLLGIYEKLNSSKIPKLVLKKKYFSNEWDSIYSILDDFFKKQSLDISTLKSACFAIAGPVKGDNCKLTNLPWNISRVELKSKLKSGEIKFPKTVNHSHIGSIGNLALDKIVLKMKDNY